MDSRAKNAPFPVLLLGCTGSGKSTLINYLMGRNMVIKKIHGRACIDVAEGKSNPVLSHGVTSETKSSQEYINQVNNISYCDTPGLSSTLYMHKTKTLDEIISSSVKQIKEKHGAIILVIELPSVITTSIVDVFLQQLKFLSDNTAIMSIPILFVATKVHPDTTNSDMAEFVAGWSIDKNDIPLIEKLMKSENWICVDMLKNQSRDEIQNWIDNVAKNENKNDLIKDPSYTLQSVFAQLKALDINNENTNNSAISKTI